MDRLATLRTPTSAAQRRTRRSGRALEIDRTRDESARQLGRAVRAARRRRHLTQAQLGDTVGLS